MSDEYLSTMYGESDETPSLPATMPSNPMGAPGVEVPTMAYVRRLERTITALVRRVETLENRVRTLQQSSRDVKHALRAQGRNIDRLGTDVEGKIDARDMP